MQLSIVAAGFTPDEADQLRRAMAAWKRKGDAIRRFGEKIIAGMLANGYPQDFAERCFEQIKGFSEYGFPESHSVSFAYLVYASSWLKHHHPAAFCAALLNAKPMGFYSQQSLTQDAVRHGEPQQFCRGFDAELAHHACSAHLHRALRQLGLDLVERTYFRKA